TSFATINQTHFCYCNVFDLCYLVILDRTDHVIVDEERERQERNHERFADILEQLERRTEELQVLQRLIEFRLREVEEEAIRVRISRLLHLSEIAAGAESKENESLIRSSAYGKCSICLDEEPLDPVGCIYCQQLVGCRRLVFFLTLLFCIKVSTISHRIK
ncbi:hypothetical protein NECAME_07491, partial [Necator americanus]